MKKDWVIFVGCIGLFASGFIFARLLAQFGYLPAIYIKWEDKLDIGTIFNIVAAIATALAAYAAFRSADTALSAAKDSRAFARVQTYTSHQQQFDRLLDECQAEMGIAFFRRIELYDKIFPTNRYSEKPFTSCAEAALVSQWGNRYDRLRGAVESNVAPDDEDIRKWIIDCVSLANDMNFTLKQPSEGQIWINDSTYSYFDHNPGKPLYNIAETIHRLARFGLMDISPRRIFARHQPVFLATYNDFYQRIKDGLTNHSIR
ncbi:hypothetical protein [Pseudomonas siliginis]|uniref:hypothetical protein n=1 Tax=Pseudomonas siliginis TaxID=2842346 RepID=UPI00209379B1|nr:hypothetical protein [Pseudomonas siliginis]UST91925.1 hypothetical protein NF678_08370 [Pseudomonas siliginis]